ncbi:MAG: biotin--[acetyl-CoA-carboxylase] ligase [bacterium]
MFWDSDSFRQLLQTRHFGREIVFIQEIDSTNRWLLEKETEFHLAGATVVANHQTAGRGRHGRRWEDVPGKSLLFSVLLRPGKDSSPLGFLSLAAGLAIAEATIRICRCPAKRVQLKWPNDVLIDGFKVAGILMESVSAGGEPRVVVGIGVNLWQEQHELPQECRVPASSLQLLLPASFSREELLTQILLELENLYDLFQEGRMEEIRRRWLAFSSPLGMAMSVEVPQAVARGIFEGIGKEGQLLLRESNGALREIYSGEIL